MSITARKTDVDPRELTRDEAHAIFSQRAQALLGISAVEFLRRWDAGEYADDEEPVMSLVMLIPFVRKNPTGPV